MTAQPPRDVRGVAAVHHDDKELLARGLEEPFNGRRPWRMALFFVPVTAYIVIARPQVVFATSSPELQRKLMHVVWRMGIANLSASPIAFLLITVQVVTFGFIALVFSSSMSNAKLLLQRIGLFMTGHDGPSSHRRHA